MKWQSPIKLGAELEHWKAIWENLDVVLVQKYSLPLLSCDVSPASDHLPSRIAIFSMFFAQLTKILFQEKEEIISFKMAPVSWTRIQIVAQTKFEAVSWKKLLVRVNRCSALTVGQMLQVFVRRIPFLTNANFKSSNIFSEGLSEKFWQIFRPQFVACVTDRESKLIKLLSYHERQR